MNMLDRRVHVWVQYFPDRTNLVLQWVNPETGQRKSKSARTVDRKKAEVARRDLEYELNHGTYQESSKLEWERFRQLFNDEYLAGLRPRTRERYNGVLHVFEQIIHPVKLRGVTERTISHFVKGMRERKRRDGKVGLAPWTIKNYLIALKTALAWAVEQKLLTGLPKFPKVRVPKLKPQPIPAESFEKLLAKAPDDLWRCFLMCGWWAGLRLSEASELRWEASDAFSWVDFEGNRIVLPAVFAKSAEDQWVPLHPALRQALAALPRTDSRVFPFRSCRDGGRLSRAGITNRVREMAKQAGVKLGMHKLRKGFGCRAAKILGRSGAAVLHELMRHSSMQVTMDFYANVDDTLQDDIIRLT
jgi:integrase